MAVGWAPSFVFGVADCCAVSDPDCSHSSDCALSFDVCLIDLVGPLLSVTVVCDPCSGVVCSGMAVTEIWLTEGGSEAEWSLVILVESLANGSGCRIGIGDGEVLVPEAESGVVSSGWTSDVSGPAGAADGG